MRGILVVIACTLVASVALSANGAWASDAPLDLPLGAHTLRLANRPSVDESGVFDATLWVFFEDPGARIKLITYFDDVNVDVGELPWGELNCSGPPSTGSIGPISRPIRLLDRFRPGRVKVRVELCNGADSAEGFIEITPLSELRVQISGRPAIRLGKHWPGLVTLSNKPGGLHDLAVAQGMFQTSARMLGTSLFTGVALITNLTLTVTNNAVTFTSGFSTPNPLDNGATPSSSTTLCPGGCLGGKARIDGQFVYGLLGFGKLPVPLDILGVGGQIYVPISSFIVQATAAPFVTGPIRITDITTNVISLPDRGGVTGVGVTLQPAATEEVRTFTTQGGFITTPPHDNIMTLPTITLRPTNLLSSASLSGHVTLISPLRIGTNELGFGNLPGFVSERFFIPEPGVAWLMLSGAAALVVLGRRRMRG
jgi:hypothetical protein